MKPAEFLALVSGGEDDRTEFKSPQVSPDVIVKVVCAFLNHKGGRVILGIGPKGETVGVANAQEVIERLQESLRTKITPSALWTIEKIQLDGKVFLIVEVSEGADKPYVADGAIYYSRK